MSCFLRCLALAALPALGQAAVAPVVIFTHFQPQPSPLVFDSIRREVASIMAPLGFPFEWRPLDSPRDSEGARQLAVVTFRGNCSTANLLVPMTISGPLGITHISSGEVIPFAEVDCDRIRTFLRRNLMRTDGRHRESVFGRAIGRVLAHELFHVFAGTARHGSGGVAEPAFTEQDLMSDRFQLETREFRILRAHLKEARKQNSRIRSATSPLAGRFIFQENGCADCHGTLGEGTQSAPTLRVAHKLVDEKTFHAKLVQGAMRLSTQAKAPRLAAPALDEDEIADVLSFLNGLE
jgi:cytochrome c551/c552